MAYKHIKVPAQGEKITVNADYSLNVPNNPVIPFIEGDGIGVDITPAMLKVVDAAVARAYGGKRKISWMRSTPARRPPNSTTATGSRPRRSTRSASTWSRSRAR